MRSKHPNTDLHRAGCPGCQMEYDKRLPDSSTVQLKTYCEMCGRSNKTLRLSPDPSGATKTLCRECRIGSEQLRKQRQL